MECFYKVYIMMYDENYGGKTQDIKKLLFKMNFIIFIEPMAYYIDYLTSQRFRQI